MIKLRIEPSRSDIERKIKLPKISKKLAEFFGILAGDGWVLDKGKLHKIAVTLNLKEDINYRDMWFNL